MKIGKQLLFVFLSIVILATYVPMAMVSAEGTREPILVDTSFVNDDFNVTNPPVSNGVYTLDAKLLGTVATTSGASSAGRIADNGSNVFYMEATTSTINSYKSSINKTDRFGIQTRAKFNNTNSKRAFFEVKSMTPPTGTAAWPTLLTFDENGNVKNSNNTTVGTYTADQWYDIVVDLDTPNHRYSAWLNGTLIVDNVDLGTWVGLLQNKIIQNKNASNAASRTTIAYLKAGIATDAIPLTALSLQQVKGNFYNDSTTTLTLTKTPSNTTDQVNLTSSNTSVVTVTNQGVLTGVAPGTATITATSVQHPSLSTSINVTVKKRLAPFYFNGSIDDINFDLYFLNVAATGVITLDSTYLGTITPAKDANGVPKNSAGLTSDGNSDVFYMEAKTASINSYKAAINNSDRIEFQTRAKFNNTNSNRDFFQVKSMTPPSGTAAWPVLIKFDNTGKIKDSKGNVLGTYAADQWYDIVIDLDSPNHRYSAWVDGIQKVNNQDLGNFVGVYQNNINQGTNTANTPSRTTFANLKIGAIAPLTTDLTVTDVTVEKGKAMMLNALTTPVGAYVENIVWTSSNPNVAKMFGNGVLALNTGATTVTATETETGVSKSFQVTVTDPTHLWNAHSINTGDLTKVLNSAYWSEVGWNYDQIMANSPELQTYLNMDETTFIQAVKKEQAKVYFASTKNKFARYARLYAQLYLLTNDTNYAKRAALIMYYQALDYPRILSHSNYIDFFAGTDVAQQDITWAYGALFDSDIWGQIDSVIPASEVKQSIQELWIRPAIYETYRQHNIQRLNNIVPYATREGATTGLLLNDPNMVHQAVNFLDRLLTNENWLSDGIWYEESASYSDQASGNVLTTIDVVKKWVDPTDYTDTQFGIQLNNTDLAPRWPLINQFASFSSDKLIYPDGTTIPVNDSYGKKGSPQPLSIVNKGLKNIELPGLGYYALFQGDTTSATHAGLLYNHTNLGFGGGHTHVNALNLDLWGGGVELLPSTGYITGTSYADGSGSNLRYPTMKPLWKNMPWVWREDGANAVGTSDTTREWTKPALLAYDPGDANGKKVQLLEASDPGVAGKGADIDRRLLIMVNLDGNRNYTFDLTRLKGGQAHEIYQRGAELEGMDVQTQDITMTNTGQPNLQSYLQSINSTQGLSTDRNLLQNPKASPGNNSFSFTWTGQQSGASLHTFMNGVSGSDVFMSQIPRARVITTKADETVLTTPQLTRRHIVTDPNQITQYGSIYEAVGSNEQSVVNSVYWAAPADADPMTTIAVVTSATYKDYIYISNDTTERSYDGMTFAGNVAMARFDLATGSLLYSYVYGTGKVVAQNQTLTGTDTEQLQITGATTSTLNTALDPDLNRKNTITVSGHFANPNALIGQRIQTQFGDGSGYGLKVLGYTENTNLTVLEVESFNPFKVTATGVETMFSPVGIAIPGNAYVIFKQPSFASN